MPPPPTKGARADVEREVMEKYPDMTKLFAAKEARRKVLANLPIEEKMEIAERLREMARDAPGHVSAKPPDSRLQTKGEK